MVASLGIEPRRRQLSLNTFASVCLSERALALVCKCCFRLLPDFFYALTGALLTTPNKCGPLTGVPFFPCFETQRCPVGLPLPRLNLNLNFSRLHTH